MKVLLLCLLLVGCQTIPGNADTPVPANLRQPCPEREALETGDGAAILKWALHMVFMYEDCKNRHGKLAEAVKPKD